MLGFLAGVTPGYAIENAVWTIENACYHSRRSVVAHVCDVMEHGADGENGLEHKIPKKVNCSRQNF